MQDRKNARPDEAEENDNENAERASTIPGDLPDSREDAEKMRGEEFTIDMPEVKDIPGQEFVHTPPAGILGDTTISSKDEEGPDALDELE